MWGMQHDPDPNSISLALPGAASHVATVAGFAIGVSRLVRIAMVAGVSAGALVAILVAFKKIHLLPKLLEKWLQANRLLDMRPDGAIGLCAWEVIPRIVDEVLGPNVTMGEAKLPLVIVVTDVDKAARGEDPTTYLTSWGTPHVLVREAAAATSALYPLARMVRIPSFGSAMSPDLRLWMDGGFAKNLPDQVFDDQPQRGISLGLRPQPVTTGKTTRVGERDAVDQAKAVLGALTAAADRPSTKRTDGLHLVATAHGSGLDFSLSPAEVRERISAGRKSAADNADAIRKLVA